jgi:hypothetical protein
MVFMTLANSVVNAKPFSITGRKCRNRLTPAAVSDFWWAGRW